MNLDQLVELAARAEPQELDHKRSQRAYKGVLAEVQRRAAHGPQPSTDVDLEDPLTSRKPEWRRIMRGAQLQKRGAVAWLAATGAVRWSDELFRMLGMAPKEAGIPVDGMLDVVHPADRDEVRLAVVSAWRTLEAGEVVCRVLRHDGSTSYVHCDIEVAADDRGRPEALVATVQDVTDEAKRRKEAERRALRDRTLLADLAELDPVTGLMSRRAFTDEVGRALADGTGTLLIISAPPYVRRRSGAAHETQLAQATTDVLRSVVEPWDPVALLGRYEYGILMRFTTVEHAAPKSAAILERLRTTSFVAASARLEAFGGLVPYDCAHPINSIDLLYDAESAWRQAKEGDTPLVVLDARPSPEDRRARCRADIRSAVEGNRFALFAQPIRDLELNRVTRHEILLRVLDEVGEPVPPETYLRRAEHLDEIVEVDKWVINRALPLIRMDAATAHCQVNISGRSISDPLLLRHLRSAVERLGVDAERLTLEITETAAIGNITIARAFAEGARELGCQIALDDFGTGNTPVSFLRQLPVDLVKIDGSFIQDLPASESSRAIVRNIATMCQDLGIMTAAEYVQDDATLDLLRQYGVDFAQGYHVGEPKRILADRLQRQSIDMALPPIEEVRRTAI